VTREGRVESNEYTVRGTKLPQTCEIGSACALPRKRLAGYASAVSRLLSRGSSTLRASLSNTSLTRFATSGHE
jgi:hypothetical protein